MPLLLVQFSTESVCRFAQGVAEINFHLSRPANPSPLSNQGPCAKQVELYAKQVVTVLIPLRVAFLKSGGCRDHNW